MIIEPTHSTDEILFKIKNLLSIASENKEQKMRIFSVSSYNQFNNTANSRMVVLRRFYSDWTLRFFTDIRSNKIGEMRKHPNVSSLFWDPAIALQIRLDAEVVIHHHNDTTKKEWKTIRGNAQKAYNSVLSPGSIIKHPSDAHQWPEEFQADNFAIVDLKPFMIQVLQLNGFEHLSARFRRNSIHEKWKGGWIVP